MYTYRYNINDFRGSCHHLSMAERGAYRDMMDVYYETEAPLPLDVSEICRRVGARNKSERRAVDVVLKDFFRRTPDGWVQSRCEREISAYKAKAEQNRTNGKAGGRPNGTHKKPDGLSVGYSVGSVSEPTNNLNPLTPYTPNHKEEENNRARALASPHAPEDFSFDAPPRLYAIPEAMPEAQLMVANMELGKMGYADVPQEMIVGQWEVMRDRHADAGRKTADLSARWRSWLRKWPEIRPGDLEDFRKRRDGPKRYAALEADIERLERGGDA